MKTLACKDIDPASTCDYEATTATTEESVGLMVEHAKSAHADQFAALGGDEAVMREKITPLVRDETPEEEIASEQPNEEGVDEEIAAPDTDEDE